MRVEGSCYCGKIAFEAEVDPQKVIVCHCSDCQALTGSAYRTVVPVLAGTFVLVRGSPKLFIKTGDSGKRRAHAFCPDCGSPVYSADPGGLDNCSLRVGTLKERHALRPKRQIWCRSALPWAMNLEGIEQIARQ